MNNTGRHLRILWNFFRKGKAVKQLLSPAKNQRYQKCIQQCLSVYLHISDFTIIKIIIFVIFVKYDNYSGYHVLGSRVKTIS